MAVMQRAFARADLPLKFSEGFNPHPQISILLPLSVGTASICELMDFRLLKERDLKTLPDRLTAVLPDGIRALEAYEAVRKSAQLKWLDIECILEYDTVKPRADELDGFFSQQELIIEKKTKHGFGQADIRPAIGRILFSDTGEGLKLRARISAQEPTLNPDHLINALRQLCPELTPDFAKFTRLETYDADGNIYR